MSDHPPFTHTLDDVAQLTDLYRAPGGAAVAKEADRLDDACRGFIARSPFLVIGTSNADGRLDVSPRGGPPGFVKVLDDHRLAIPDLNGNNRLDSIRNIIEHGQVGLLFVVPGLGETLRINGAACITTDPAILDLFADEVRRPATAIGVTFEQGFLHCAKAFRRGGLWQPETWPGLDDQPSAGQMLLDHAGLDGQMTAEQVTEMLEESYRSGLAADSPEG